MGAGKSLVASCLREMTGRTVVSTDAEIERREGRTIPEIFRDSGEPYFRRLEREVTVWVAGLRGLIVDCGGGLIVDPVNRRRLKDGGVIFYLAASPEEIYRRVASQTHRPLLRVPDPLARIRALLEERRPFYEEADHMVETEGRSGAAVAREILEIVHRREGGT